ncbi:RagB/SusD family nutrient uptake outer membrane protein [Flavitalea sp. BT771]|uniref:RagB/SusD family nutrient uptake outer membrane protein n=1 Tax=Flavitalea sp. BT771 TaxID=3063329 RepID=UPI0026E48BA3|nr:RagB/SusD family nutrient uptake outer membrane protein [Flavitalea sp. BT771]MDO6435441.1 RagB/SusD family nutrient uptake outer membrane protein [Flavitalea sp. BT771]MDV6224199.1 RagB/SusD family nutrient uptake outer membrane protein [Flavitalea sp. BT771]
MSTIKNICLVLLLASVTLPGCKGDLKEITYSDLSAQTYKYTDAYAAMGIAYANLRGLFSHSNWYMLQETSSDELVMPANSSGWEDAGIYKRIHLHTWNSENPQMINMWLQLYAGVTNCNRVLDQLDKDVIPPAAGTTKEGLIGEMKVLRAFYYWQICDNFGNAPLVNSTATELPSTAKRQEIYDFIVKDINDALPSLSENTDKLMYGRFNKWAAKALLANIYLNAEVYTGQAKWQECLAQCNDILGSPGYHLEGAYKDIFKTQNENSSEIIFAVPFDENQGQGFFVEMYSWHGAMKDKYNMQATPWGSGSAQGIPQFIDTYSSDDHRLGDTWLMGPQFKSDGVTPLKGSYDKNGQPLNFVNHLPDGLFTSETEGYRMNKFEVKTGALADLSNDFPFFRLAQVMMMKAECLLRTGHADDAAAIVTNVRNRAFADPAKATVTGAQLQGNSKYHYGYVENYNIVDPGDQSAVQFGGMLDELGYEFPWEAQRRRDDIRFGVFTKKSWLSHKPNGDYRTIFPIPQAALNSNPNLDQNDGYK